MGVRLVMITQRSNHTEPSASKNYPSPGYENNKLFFMSLGGNWPSFASLCRVNVSCSCLRVHKWQYFLSRDARGQ